MHAGSAHKTPSSVFLWASHIIPIDNSRLPPGQIGFAPLGPPTFLSASINILPVYADDVHLQRGLAHDLARAVT